MLIVNVPIEPIEERYSADWGRWFEKELQDRKLDYWTIHDNMWMLRKDIKEGAFLDVVGTNHYKAKQIAFICNLVDQSFIKRNERVVFLIQDGWFPVEQLAYMRDMLGCHDWKFVGIFHAGTYDRWDQTAQHGMYTWGEDLENAWFKIYDSIIVASQYHNDLLLSTHDVRCPMHIIPWKVEVPQDVSNTKLNVIVYPHRRNPEKQPELLKSIELPEGWRLAVTHGCTTKREYYETLAKSKIAVSFSLQETFGIAMVEAVLLGCIPLVPDRLSYKEMYPECFRYKGESDFKWKLAEMIHDEGTYYAALRSLKQKFQANSQEFFDKLEDIIHNL